MFPGFISRFIAGCFCCFISGFTGRFTACFTCSLTTSFSGYLRIRLPMRFPGRLFKRQSALAPNPSSISVLGRVAKIQGAEGVTPRLTPESTPPLTFFLRGKEQFISGIGLIGNDL
ncbi:hypothetical protein CH330_01995 [candidate division WOR-3 bacterium JGI_Cruoil_03_51_56]|uniref:Uncharacterized protein n=1 Tax=candidate division WOR-3 bacterium JGI_Cruoil_03_51_56 TaxID=1973747 RepID=A0A235BY32_UNCW3|nr:MAG: hypothetical protein CH330_01995 [candidate division WOR-3 bacterium JGI_Cruoil_03_51_56]